MSHTPPYCLIDTNVWVDNYLGSRPGTSHSRALIAYARESGCELLYPVHVIKDVYYLVANGLKALERAEKGFLAQDVASAIEQIAMASVQNMSEIATAVGADGSDVWLALKLHKLHHDLEDDLVLAAAERSQADMLVTNDERLILKSTVPAHTPEDALALLQM